MRTRIILDTGPLVALLNRRDQFHDWAQSEWAKIEPPLVTCEAVISEACFLLRNTYNGSDAVVELVQNQVVQIRYPIVQDVSRVRTLLRNYRSVPMSLADACLVVMAEQWSKSAVLTLDSDFQIYRKHRNELVPVVMPL